MRKLTKIIRIKVRNNFYIVRYSGRFRRIKIIKSKVLIMKNKSKFRNIIIILLLFILLFPIPMRLKDGGSIRFQALLYSVTKVHRLNDDSEAENEFLI